MQDKSSRDHRSHIPSDKEVFKDCKEGNSERIKQYLNLANFKIVNKRGLSPLMVAIQNDQQDVALLIMDSSALEIKTYKKRETALHLAAAKGNYALVKHLLEHNAKVDALNYHKRTPLHQKTIYCTE